ncbi:MAG: GH25 family lysozyme [Oscillospiraceae bacterium]|nr:GH25 family lysozyme [Oscillospiraceae bacterium]MDD4413189.1 GH25 family lysozyme [Oscillospiraceae bacterium]
MTTFQGVDASLSQGNIDWFRVKSFNNSFAMLRATVGWDSTEIQTDSSFHRNVHDASQAGLMVGAYHSSMASNADEAHHEAECFLHAVNGYKLAFPVAIDVETRPLRTLHGNRLDEIIRAWCGDILGAGYYPMIRAQLTTVIRRLNPQTLKEYDLWLQYPSNAIDYDGAVGIWQYTAFGNVGGVRGRIGKNHAFLDYPKIMQERGLNGFTAPVAAAPDSDTHSLESCSSSLMQILNTLSGLAALSDILSMLAECNDACGFLNKGDDENIIEDAQANELYPEISEKLKNALNHPIITKSVSPIKADNLENPEGSDEPDE